MPEPDPTPRVWSGPPRYSWDTPEFARVTNLSDGVFAIALTLLVLTLDVPDVGRTDVAGALLAEAPRGGPLRSQLPSRGEPLVGAPPLSLVGRHLTAPAAVVPFIAVFLAITLLFSIALLRARGENDWREPLPRGLFGWLLGGWFVYATGLTVPLVVAFRWPVAGLVILAASGPLLSVFLGRIAPSSYRPWVT